MSINEFVCSCYAIAKEHGFHERAVTFDDNQYNTRHILSWLMLVTTEVAEAAEAVRQGFEEGFIEELADICIRVFDIAGALNIDLEAAIAAKMGKNSIRSFRHGGKRA